MIADLTGNMCFEQTPVQFQPRKRQGTVSGLRLEKGQKKKCQPDVESRVVCSIS